MAPDDIQRGGTYRAGGAEDEDALHCGPGPLAAHAVHHAAEVADALRDLAKEHGLHSIAFPAISTGVYGYPPQEAAAVALRTVSAWLSANPNYGMAVVMSCFDQKTRQCCQNVIDACAPGKE